MAVVGSFFWKTYQVAVCDSFSTKTCQRGSLRQVFRRNLPEWQFSSIFRRFISADGQTTATWQLSVLFSKKHATVAVGGSFAVKNCQSGSFLPKTATFCPKLPPSTVAVLSQILQKNCQMPPKCHGSCHPPLSKPNCQLPKTASYYPPAKIA